MKITFKNNNVYYYHYKIIRGELSFVLVPIGAILIYYLNNYIKYVSLIFLLVGIVGLLDSYYKIIQEKIIGLFILIIILHLVGFYPLLNVKKYFEYNNIIYVFGLLSLLIVYFLPYWPYAVSKKVVMNIIILLYSSYTLYHIYKNKLLKISY